jgi:hypothetical protein
MALAASNMAMCIIAKTRGTSGFGTVDGMLACSNWFHSTITSGLASRVAAAPPAQIGGATRPRATAIQVVYR